MPEYRRPAAATLEARLAEPRRFIQVIAGPRQVGKTTLVIQVAERLRIRCRYASADQPTLRGPGWIAEQWDAARAEFGRDDGVLIPDEVQKAADWAEAVKRLWDEDTRQKRPLRVVLLGAAPVLMQRGLSESLAGRFEVIRLTHWSPAEMREAFGWSVEQAIFYDGYPGAAPRPGPPRPAQARLPAGQAGEGHADGDRPGGAALGGVGGEKAGWC